ncbi:MAG: c-type cytochrome, partial [Methylococcales bacterium]
MKWSLMAVLGINTFSSTAITENLFDPIQWNLGRALYQQGIRISPEADPNIVQIDQSLAPMALFTCAQCHGDRAQGRQESGIRAPGLTWDELSKPYAVPSGQHRRRAPYNRETFARALILGIDPSGNELSPPMPRYRLESDEVAAMIEYLANIDRESVIGIDGQTIRLRLRLAAGLPEKPMITRGLDRFVQAFVHKINRQGGIYRRQLSLSLTAPNGIAQDPPAFILLDLSGPEAESNVTVPLDLDQSSRAGVTIRLFGQDDSNERSLTIWPRSIFGRDALQSVARNRWNSSESSLGTWQQLADYLDSNSVSPKISKQSIAIVLDPPEPALLNQLTRITPRNAPTLLIENWFGNPRLARFSEQYPGSAYALVPVIPLRERQSPAQDYPSLADHQTQSGVARIHQLWTLFALERINRVLRSSGRDLTTGGFIENW